MDYLRLTWDILFLEPVDVVISRKRLMDGMSELLFSLCKRGNHTCDE